MEHKAWQVLSREQIVEILPWISLWKEEVRLPDGRVVDDYYQLDLPDIVIVAAFDNDGYLVTERHYKHGARQVVLDLPAGFLESDETPLAAAKRELLEETGFGDGSWHALGAFRLCGNRGCGKAHIFLASEVEQSVEPMSEDLELTEVILMKPNDFSRAINKGEVVVLSMVAAFLLAKMQLQNHVKTEK